MFSIFKVVKSGRTIWTCSIPEGGNKCVQNFCRKMKEIYHIEHLSVNRRITLNRILYYVCDTCELGYLVQDRVLGDFQQLRNSQVLKNDAIYGVYLTAQLCELRL
jgi:hypothetical protein